VCASRTSDRPRADARKRTADALGALALAAGLWTTANGLAAPVIPYDEGLLLTHSQALLGGAVPHRDFYSNYPPGIYLLIAGLWSLGGQTPWTLRFLGFALHAAIALLLGRLVGRALARAFCPLTAGLVLIWLSPLQTVPYAWLAGLAAALAAVELWLARGPQPTRLSDLGRGAAFGAIACFRHDLFLSLALASALLALARRGSRVRPRGVSWLVAGAALPLAAAYGPVLSRAGLALPLQDLVVDQLRWVGPARWLPLSAFFSEASWLPAFLFDLFAAGSLLVLAGPALAALALAAARAPGRPRPRAALALAALSLAMLPQLIRRADLPHALLGVAPAVAACALLLRASSERLRSAPLAATLLVAGAALVAAPLRAPLSARLAELPALPSGPAPYYGLPVRADRQQALALVARLTRPDEPIYVGRREHSRLTSNEVDFYYFAGRPGATRQLQFDPGSVTRAPVQREMIRQLEAKGTRLAVLSTCCLREEPNESRRSGARLLDRYLRARFAPIAGHGRYLLLWRRGAPGPERAEGS